jgi:anti-sigma regulatory factor (Ser/Thr protein kinase)
VTLWLEHRVELEFPMKPQLFFLARMLGGAVAARAGFEEGQVLDLRLAVDELLVNLVRGRAAEKTVHLDYRWNDQAIEVVATLYEGWAEDHRQRKEPLDDDVVFTEISESILGSLADQHGSPSTDQAPISWLRLSRR